MNGSDSETTGRHLIFFHRGGLASTAKMAEIAAGITMPDSIAAAESATITGEWRDSGTFVIPALGVIVSSADPDQIRRLSVGGNSPIRHIREEYIFEIAGNTDPAYLRGYRAGVNSLVDDLLRDAGLRDDLSAQDEIVFTDNAEFTWGLQAMALTAVPLTGNGVRVAILDTGFDEAHPDFNNRGIESRSFLSDVPTAQDDHGHGTHCLGSLAGPKVPYQGPRYGVACDSTIFVGKVMNSAGKGKEGDILHGIGWALQNQCRVISMSFGKTVDRGDAPDPDYEDIGRIALSKNCLLVAAAGNDSGRPGFIAPVELPANSRTFLAVGALNRRLGLYLKSNGGVNLDGGGVDLVGPGVDVYSSKRLPRQYGLDTGTSMATPHVAGATALLIEADPAATAEQIWSRLTQNANRLPLASTDVGAGMVQAG